MFNRNFEDGPPAPALTGEICVDVYAEPDARPATVIRTDQEWGVRVHWDLRGQLAPFIHGRWSLHLYLEPVGNGPGRKLEPYLPSSIPIDPCGGGEYDFDFRVRPGTVKTEHCFSPYRLVFMITYLTESGRPGPIAGFVEGPVLQFYEPLYALDAFRSLAVLFRSHPARASLVINISQLDPAPVWADLYPPDSARSQTARG